MNQQAMNLKKS